MAYNGIHLSMPSQPSVCHSSLLSLSPSICHGGCSSRLASTRPTLPSLWPHRQSHPGFPLTLLMPWENGFRGKMIFQFLMSKSFSRQFYRFSFPAVTFTGKQLEETREIWRPKFSFSWEIEITVEIWMSWKAVAHVRNMTEGLSRPCLDAWNLVFLQSLYLLI